VPTCSNWAPGTGYTAALLPHRLGGEHVTSVEIDPDLHRGAVERLDARDLRPTLLSVTAPSRPPHAAYDRVLVEHETPMVPLSWVPLVRLGGGLLAQIGGGLGGGRHVPLRRPADGEPVLSGRFLPWTGAVAPHRAPARCRALRRPPDAIGRPTRTGSTLHPPAALLDGGPLALLAQLLLPPGTQVWKRAPQEGRLGDLPAGP